MTKPLSEFKTFLKGNVNYECISKMSFDEYKNLVYDLFGKLNEWRSMGLRDADISTFVNEHYTEVMSADVDDDILFERRFSGITEELVGFCSDPRFWDVDFDSYLKKWDRAFNFDWYKKIQ